MKYPKVKSVGVEGGVDGGVEGGVDGGVEGGVGELNGQSTMSELTVLMLRATDRLADNLLWQCGHGK